MKKQVNLYQPSCYPERQKWSFLHFLAVFGAAISLSSIAYFVTSYQTDSLHEQLVMQKAALSKKQSQLTELVSELQKRKTPDAKIRQYKTLQNEVAAKRRLLGSIAGIDMQELVSFSAVMRGLSHANMANLSINHFSMTNGILNVNGNAKYSDSLPLWLSNVQVTKELSSVAFKALSIKETEGSFTFQLSNSDLKGKANE